MIEQQDVAVIFYAHYVSAQVSKTGLTVTVDVWEVQRDGTAAEIVSGAAATEIGDGLYRYLLAAGSVDEPAEYIAVFKTADTTVSQRDIPAMWVIERAGIEDLDATVSSRASAATTALEATAQSILTDTAEIGAAGAGLTAVPTAVLAAVVENSKTVQDFLRIIKAAVAGKASGGGTTTIVFRDDADSKARITATVDANGNRTAVTLDPA